MRNLARLRRREAVGRLEPEPRGAPGPLEGGAKAVSRTAERSEVWDKILPNHSSSERRIRGPQTWNTEYHERSCKS